MNDLTVKAIELARVLGYTKIFAWTFRPNESCREIAIYYYSHLEHL